MVKFRDTPPGRYDRTPAGKAHHKMLSSRRWKDYSLAFLATHPLCECPHHRGLDANCPTQVVDHIKRPRGDHKLFWDPKNHCGMNGHCHNTFKQSEERGGHGFAKGCDENGMPLALDSPWHQSR